jgi:hypothetical protein
MLLDIQKLDKRYHVVFDQRDNLAQLIAKNRVDGTDLETVDGLIMELNSLDEVE